MSSVEHIFCCHNAFPMGQSNVKKLHKDPNREVHDAIFTSFMNFVVRTQTAAALMAYILGVNSPDSSGASSPNITPKPMYSPPQEIPAAILTLESLKNNPVTPNTPYVIHLTSRHDFGPVFSHRYFVCPANLQHDWVEASLQQWFAAGAQFKLTAEKRDVKCATDENFFRLTLLPNLAMRFHPEADVVEGIAG